MGMGPMMGGRAAPSIRLHDSGPPPRLAIRTGLDRAGDLAYQLAPAPRTRPHQLGLRATIGALPIELLAPSLHGWSFGANQERPLFRMPIPMSASQGRERRTAARTRLGWLGAALAASGLHASTGAAPALACHIAHHASAQQPATAAAQGLQAPVTNPAQDYRNLMHLCQQVKDQNAAAQAPTTPVTTTSAQAPAAEILPTATTTAAPTAPTTAVVASPVAAPTVANWHQNQPSTCTPPPPPPCSGSIPTGGTGGANPPASPSISLTPPAAQTLQTPEPSTLLTALLLAGGLAWRRRSAR